MFYLFVAGLIGALSPASGVAASNAAAVVEQVQWPAWLDKGGVRSPVVAGQRVEASDQLATGDQARLVLRLPDGSAVKLGERALLKVSDMQESEPGLLNAGFEVAKGAFRFTTGLFNKVLGRRDVRVRFPTLTIGVRGTDFWGKSDEQREMVLLLEGSVALTRQLGAQIEEKQMVDTASYLYSDQGAPLKEAKASPLEVKRWAAETEPDASRPGGRPLGSYRAAIVGGLELPLAEHMAGVLTRAGYPVTVVPSELRRDPATGESQRRYTVTLAGLVSSQDAAKMRRTLRGLLQQSGLNFPAAR